MAGRSAQAEIVQRRSATGHEGQDETRRQQEEDEREDTAREEAYTRKMEGLTATMGYVGAAALRVRVTTAGGVPIRQPQRRLVPRQQRLWTRAAEAFGGRLRKKIGNDNNDIRNLLISITR